MSQLMFKTDILTAITDDTIGFNVLSALPTGYGKTIPQLLLSSINEGDMIIFISFTYSNEGCIIIYRLCFHCYSPVDSYPLPTIERLWEVWYQICKCFKGKDGGSDHSFIDRGNKRNH